MGRRLRTGIGDCVLTWMSGFRSGGVPRIHTGTEGRAGVTGGGGGGGFWFDSIGGMPGFEAGALWMLWSVEVVVRRVHGSLKGRNNCYRF